MGDVVFPDKNRLLSFENKEEANNYQLAVLNSYKRELSLRGVKDLDCSVWEEPFYAYGKWNLIRQDSGLRKACFDKGNENNII